MPLFDLLAGTLDGVFAVDRNQRIAFWNDAARQMLGFEPEAVIGRFCYEVLDGKFDSNGHRVCGRACSTFHGAVCGKLSPTRDANVLTFGGGRKFVSFSTFVVPSSWHDLSLLVHVFREAGNSHQVAFRLARELTEATGPEKSDDGPRPLEPLTRREREALRLLVSGASTASMCAQLGIEATTVRTHVRHILSKLGVHSRLEAVASAARNELLGVADRGGGTPGP